MSEIVGFEVRDEMARLGLDDRFRVDADDVSGAVELHTPCDPPVRDGAVHALRAKRELDIEPSAQRRIRRTLVLLNRIGEPLTQPGQKGVRRKLRHDQAASETGMTCNFPERPGFARRS